MIVWGIDDRVRDFVSARFPHVAAAGGFQDGYAAGFVEGGVLVGGVVLTHVTTFDGHVSIVLDSPRVLTPGALDALFSVPFRRLGLKRLTILTDPRNKRVRRLAEGLGWTLEGKMRCGLDGERDALVYGMLASECRWIKGREYHGFHSVGS